MDASRIQVTPVPRKSEHPYIVPEPQSEFLRGSEHHAEISSTNDRALELCGDELLPIPYLIATDHQTSGRGRGSNRWWSNDGALMFSVIIDAFDYKLPESRWPQVSLTVGAAVCETLVRTFAEQLRSTDAAAQPRIGLKWPNDVWINGRKACGILVEIPPSRSGRLVIGVGLNVNNSFASAPEEMRSIATSMFDEAERVFDRSAVLAMFLSQLDSDLRNLAADDGSLPARWRSHCVLTGREITLESGTQTTTGYCLGIAPDGALQLQLGWNVQRFYGGIVRKIETPAQ